MRTYYLFANGNQEGPLTLEEVKARGFEPGTLVWYEGAENWMDISTLPEFNAPAYNVTNNPVAQSDVPDGCPEPHMGLAILAAILFPTGIAAIVKTALIKPRWEAGRYDDAIYLAKSAAKFTKISIIIGAILLTLYLIYFIGIIATGIGVMSEFGDF